MKEEVDTEVKPVISNAVKEETTEHDKKKRKLPVAPTTSASASSGSKDGLIAPTKKVKTEETEDKSWWDTAQYQRQNSAWYASVQKVTDEGHRSGNLNKLLLLMAQYELGNWDECTRLNNV